MPFNFRVVFSGICAFVPAPDGSFDDPENRTGFFDAVTVILPDLRRARAVDGGNARDSHLARLELKSGQGWVSFGRQPDLIAPRIGKDVYKLDRERVSFRFSGAATPSGIKVQNFPSVPTPNPQQPNPGEERFFWWVPKMERVVPRSNRVRSDLLEDAAESVVGWVELTQGSLSSHSLSPSVMVFKPINGRGRLRQRIAGSIALEVSQVDSVEIVLRKRGGEESSLRLSGVSGDVEIEIKNRELDHLFGQPIVLPPPGPADRPDVDFTTYFEMTSTPAPVAIVPHEPRSRQGSAPPIGAQGSGRPIGLSIGGVCPPAAFSGSAPAVQPSAARKVTVPQQKAALRKRHPR